MAGADMVTHDTSAHVAPRDRAEASPVSVHLLHVVGARPNFPKLAPVHRAAVAAGLRQTVVHTGQHYDDALSAGFVRTLGIPEPDVNLAVGSASHAQQTARIMERIEPVLVETRPDWVVVYGDVNSTMAAALVATKLGIRVAHVEAGSAQRRSRDARGDQPHRHRSPQRSPAHPVARRVRRAARRGRAGKRDRLRRQRHDRHAVSHAAGRAPNRLPPKPRRGETSQSS